MINKTSDIDVVNIDHLASFVSESTIVRN